MAWFEKKSGNRRLDRGHVLDVKMRSEPLRVQRMRTVGLGVCSVFAALLVVVVLWRGGQWALNRLVFENNAFAILRLDAQSDGVIPLEKIRRWSGVRVGDNLYALDLVRVRRDLELSPLIRLASIERLPPHTLSIRVYEREPIAQVLLPSPIRRDGVCEPIQYFLDADGFVMTPPQGISMEKFVRGPMDSLPVITGINPFDLRAGRQIDSAKVGIALDLIAQFERSKMFVVEEIKTIDISNPEVLVVNTVQGSEVTLATSALEKQLYYWKRIYDEGRHIGKAIASIDLSITSNIPVRFIEAAAVPRRALKNPKTARVVKRHV